MASSFDNPRWQSTVLRVSRRLRAVVARAAGARCLGPIEAASMGQWTPAGFDPAASATVGPIPIRGGVLGDARVASILPSQGHHQGNTSVSIFGSGFLFNSSEIRCCWDHHPGYLSSQVIKDGRVLGGDGVADEQTVPTHVSDTLLVCHPTCPFRATRTRTTCCWPSGTRVATPRSCSTRSSTSSST